MWERRGMVTRGGLESRTLRSAGGAQGGGFVLTAPVGGVEMPGRAWSSSPFTVLTGTRSI